MHVNPDSLEQILIECHTALSEDSTQDFRDLIRRKVEVFIKNQKYKNTPSDSRIFKTSRHEQFSKTPSDSPDCDAKELLELLRKNN